ncbi:hypothetical protein [Methylibium sp.]|uniref:hypothetical protein n=1 Tax=Methylibium sp. TaxID=2067992 RepID=UPI0017FA5DB2|nr:hypothetical protein [Methylibium sp.]MBA3588195.1 hypothetical protein [Methylibium sp.]
MADNVTLNAGTGGDTAAADDVGGVKFQRVKISVGADGTAQDNWTPSRLISAATTNATSVKASAGALGFIYAVNLNAAVRYLKLYNKASAPTVGTDTPVATLPIPASTTGAGFTLAIPGGLAFTTGIAYAVTTGAADSNTAAVAASEIFLLLGYA